MKKKVRETLKMEREECSNEETQQYTCTLYLTLLHTDKGNYNTYMYTQVTLLAASNFSVSLYFSSFVLTTWSAKVSWDSLASWR